MQVQRIPLWFNQAATRSIGAVNNHEGASVHVRFLLAMQSNPGAADIRDRSLFIAWGGRSIFVVTSEHLPDPPVEYLVF